MSTQNDWEDPKLGLAKIVKIEIEEVPEGYVRPYISFAKLKSPLTLMPFVENMLPTQEETFTREEYPLMMFGYSNKYRQGYYVKKEFEEMFKSLFREFIALEYERGKANARKEVMKEFDEWIKSWGSIPETNEYANGWNECRQELYRGYQRLLATLKEETK